MFFKTPDIKENSSLVLNKLSGGKAWDAMLRNCCIYVAGVSLGLEGPAMSDVKD